RLTRDSIRSLPSRGLVDAQRTRGASAFSYDDAFATYRMTVNRMLARVGDGFELKNQALSSVSPQLDWTACLERTPTSSRCRSPGVGSRLLAPDRALARWGLFMVALGGTAVS
uniref:hypothetical protein n=1 Tax=Rhabdothermincola sp. TaxID=2820405 RepID=UPI002FE1C5E9